jgi:hypothetical protein
MKGAPINKETNYSLLSSENYKKTLDCDVVEASKKYSQLIIDYYKFIVENLKITNAGFSKFIIIRGLDTITNVFLHILYFTKNINLTYFHCQKSFYFYVEFVGQISDVEKTFLQLTSRDATTYVYKKTIFELKSDFKKPSDNDEEFKSKLDLIHSNINMNQSYILKIIKSSKVEPATIDCIPKLTEKLSAIHNKSNASALEKITDILYYKVGNVDAFFEINSLLLKKISKTHGLLHNAEKKCDALDFESKLLEPADKFISWFLSPSTP